VQAGLAEEGDEAVVEEEEVVGEEAGKHLEGERANLSVSDSNMERTPLSLV
jgi:hypothetical protein